MASNKVRVGITTNLEERKKYWKRKYPNLQDWRAIDNGLSRLDAQKKEDEYAERHGCESHHGGPKISGKKYSVYRFNY